MKKTPLARYAGMAVLFVLGIAYNAQAVINLSPASPFLIASGDENNNQASIDAVNTDCGCTSTSAYKQNAPTPGGSEEGAFAGSYTTTMSATAFTITYDGSPDPSAPAGTYYLIVKDGNASPNWYVFKFTWDGQEQISGSNFFINPTPPPPNFSISHVEIRTNPLTVPEPSSIILLGFAFVGIGMASRRWLRG